MHAWQVVIEKIEQATGQNFNCLKVNAMHGGDINQVYQLQGAEQSYFVKLNIKPLKMNKLKQRTLALASLLQSTTLVDQLANTGTCNTITLYHQQFITF
jgi:fructosamine-3-kinase